MLNHWMQDLRHAARALRRSPGFAAVTIGTLGLAIGANVGMFSVVDAVLLNPLPFPNADRLMYVAATAPGTQMPDEFGVSSEFLVQYREQSKLIEDLSLVNSFTSTLRTSDRVERIRMSAPTTSMFTTLGVQPLLGRLPVEDDESRVAVISYALWQTWFGGDSSVIGRSYQISGDSRMVIGVMGPDFRFPTDGTLLWFPVPVRPTDVRTGRFGSPMLVRLKPGVTQEAAAAEFTALARRLPERFGGTANYARIIEKLNVVVRPLDAQLVGAISRPLWILLGAAGIVLLIACANVANLFMVRADGRLRELAVRRAIGSGRWALIRMQMAEAVVVAVLAGVMAVLLAWLVFPMYVQVAPPDIPRIGDVGVGPAALLAALAAAVLAALACGLAPAIRGSEPDLARLRDGSRGATRHRSWGRDGLVVAQTALALVLLISSGLLVRSLSKLSNVDPGYDTRDVFTFQIAPEADSLSDGPSLAQFDLHFMERLRELPSVQLVGLVENVPLNEGTRLQRFHAEGTDADAGAQLNVTFAAGDYFQVMGISVLGGRVFRTDDHVAGRNNAIVSRSAAQLLWPDEDPIGRRLQPDESEIWFNVIGVVEDVKQDDYRQAGQPLVYLSLVGPTADSWGISSPAYVLKTPRAEFIAPEVRALVRQVAPEAPMYRIFTMAGLAKDSMAQLSFMMLTLGIAAALALILGSVGLYGVLSYVVSQRTREIGVRMALGAAASEVRRMVVLQGARVVGLGIVIGLATALLATRALGALLYGVAAIDLPTFLAMSAMLVGVGVLASYVPARRASSVDPVEALRGE